MLTAKTEFGDFQTPAMLAEEVCAALTRLGVNARSLIEPNCGLGAFLSAGLKQFAGLEAVRGFDINPKYVRQAGKAVADARADVMTADFFLTEWESVIASLPSPVLIVGNPPWVTNAQLGGGGGRNLPHKTNLKKHRGLDAVTGKANFDICEWMLLRMFEAMDGREGTVAMLCKSSVARKALQWAWERHHRLLRCSMHRIDAKRHFNVAVDAVLLVVSYGCEGKSQDAGVYSDLESKTPSSRLGLAAGRLVADADAYSRSAIVRGDGFKWRSGVKHDAAKVMELTRNGSTFVNGSGKRVEIEGEFLYPMLKSSGVAAGRPPGDRWMLVPQRKIGEDTQSLAEAAPKTWAYLNSNRDRLNLRRSSIYRGRPPFSVFGVGSYTFAPWKVAVSGFYYPVRFRVVGPYQRRPVVFDDTVYFLPFQQRKSAEEMATALRSPVAADYLTAHIFRDAKRPVTSELLGGLDLRPLGVTDPIWNDELPTSKQAEDTASAFWT